jgi:hypothetical protein
LRQVPRFHKYGQSKKGTGFGEPPNPRKGQNKKTMHIIPMIGVGALSEAELKILYWYNSYQIGILALVLEWAL